MSKQATDATVSAILLLFLKKLTDEQFRSPEGKKLITKKATVKEDKTQKGKPGIIKNEAVSDITEDTNNFRRLRERIRRVRDERKGTNQVIASLVLDEYRQDPRLFRNVTEAKGINEIYTPEFINVLQDRQRVGEVRAGEQLPERTPEAEEPVPTKKKKREVPPLIKPEEDSDEDIDYGQETKNFYNDIKNFITDEEGQRYINEALQRTRFSDPETALSSALSTLRRLVLNNVDQSDTKTLNNLRLRYHELQGRLYNMTPEYIQDLKQQDLFVDPVMVQMFESRSRYNDWVESQKPTPVDDPLASLKDVARNLSIPEDVKEDPRFLPAGSAKPTKGAKKLQKPKTTPGIERAKTAIAMEDALKATGLKEDIKAVGEQVSDLQQLMKSNPEIKKIYEDIQAQFKKGGLDITKTKTKLKGLGLDNKVVDELIKTIPEENRGFLGNAVRSIAGRDNVNMNTVVSGLVGLAVSLAGAPVMMPAVATGITQAILNSYDIDLGSYFREEQKEAPAETRLEGVPGFGEFVPQSYFRSDISGATATTEELRKWLMENRDIAEKIKDISPADSLRYRQLFELFEEKQQQESDPVPSKKPTSILEPEEEFEEDHKHAVTAIAEATSEHHPDVPQHTALDYAMEVVSDLPAVARQQIAQLKKLTPEQKASVLMDQVISDKPEVKEIGTPIPTSTNRGIVRSILSGIGDRLSAIRASLARAPRPTAEQVRAGIGAGALYSALSAGMSTGTAQGAVSSVIPGAVAGGVTSAVTAPMIESYMTERGVPVDADMKRKIKMLSMMPPAAVGAWLGFTPSGKLADVVGRGVTSGAGITEQKITVEPSVLEKTQAQLDQDPSGNKVWQPKSISPTTDILDVPKQEKYADDVEFIAFNYIPPTSEGAQGTVDTNPLKYQQLLESKIRYTDAGVYIPYVTWNKINDANTMTDKRLRTMALGPQLPPMKFNTFDNDTTFENVAKLQFVNGENTAIEFQSPYADFSNVENSWWTNEDNVLFTENP